MSLRSELVDARAALAEWRFYAHTQRAEVTRLTAEALYWRRMAELHAAASSVAQRLLAERDVLIERQVA